jgi:hypothetical protein
LVEEQLGIKSESVQLSSESSITDSNCSGIGLIHSVTNILLP